MTDTDREKMIDKVRALFAKTVDAGCTEDEAISAAAKAGDLMDQYDLTQSEVDLEREQSSIDPEGKVWGKKKAHESWMAVSAVGRFTNCTGYRDNKHADVECVFIGFPQDREVAFYLMELIKNCMEMSFRQYLNSSERPEYVHGRTLRASFMRGMVARIAVRLNVMTAARKRAKQSSSTALVVLKDQLVIKRMNELGIHVRGISSNYQGSTAAHAAGREAGNKVNLTTGLGGNADRTRLH